MLPGSGNAEQIAGRATGTQSLYRKYRPASFDSDDLVGQDHIVGTLRNAIARERVAHAYLFCGPRGTGKTSTARLLAKAVNCLDPDPERRPCNICEACEAINQGRATDIIEIDAASNRGIEDMRELVERVRYAPAQLRTKVYIIDEAHQVTPAAFNAFLKTLEEPPPNTVFILATTDPDKLLDTIASRCQRFDFHRIAPDVMARHIRVVCEREDIQIDDDALDIVVRRSFGGMRDALSLVDQLTTTAGEASNGIITLDLVRGMLGISAEGWEYDLAQALAGRDVPGGLRVINQAVEGGQDMRAFGRRVVDLLRVMMLVRAGADPVEAKGNQRLIELAGRFELPEILAINRHFYDIDYKIRTGGFPQLPIELAFLGALVEQPRGVGYVQPSVQSQPQPEPQPQTRPEGRRQAEPAAGAQPVASERVRPIPNRDRAPEPPLAPPAQSPGDSWSAPARPASARAQHEPSAPLPPPVERTAPDEAPRPALTGPPAAILQTLIAGWECVRTEVRAVDRKVEALMRETDPVEVQGNDLRVVAAYPFHAGKLNDPRIREIMEAAIERVTGARLVVTVVARDEFNPIPPPAAASTMLNETSPVWGAGYGASAPPVSSSNGNGSSYDHGHPLKSTDPVVTFDAPAHGLPDIIQKVKVALDAEEMDPEDAAMFLRGLEDDRQAT